MKINSVQLFKIQLRWTTAQVIDLLILEMGETPTKAINPTEEMPGFIRLNFIEGSQRKLAEVIRQALPIDHFKTLKLTIDGNLIDANQIQRHLQS